MDLELLRTFRELHRTRHFGHTAENLFLSQSTVSARIRQLEQQLGVELFSRDRNNIQLTAAGVRFLPYAEQILDTWSRVRQGLGAGEGGETLLVGAVPIMWELALHDWICALSEAMPHLGISADPLNHELLLRRIIDGHLDLALMFEQLQYESLSTLLLQELTLQLYATTPDISASEALGEEYLYLDWGSQFAAFHASQVPLQRTVRARLGSLTTVVQLLKQRGGSAYLPADLETPFHVVADAPRFKLPIYAVYARRDEERLAPVLNLFKQRGRGA